MDELLVAVLPHHHLLPVPHHLVEMLLHTVQRQAFEGMFIWRYHRLPSMALHLLSMWLLFC